MKAVLALLAALLAGGYALLALYLYRAQPGMVWIPDREIAATPGALGIPFEALTLTAEDGVRLRAWFIPAPGATHTLLYLHGNAGDLGDRLEPIALFHHLGYQTLFLDYRGYGESDGTPDEEGSYRDAEAAWRHLTSAKGVPPERIVIYGHSLGAAVATHLAAAHPAALTVLEGAFTSVPDLGAEHYPWLPVRLLARIRYANRERVAKVRSPLLIIHARRDEIIPFHHAEELFAAAREPKRLLAIDSDHNQGVLTHPELLDTALKEALAAPPGRE